MSGETEKGNHAMKSLLGQDSERVGIAYLFALHACDYFKHSPGVLHVLYLSKCDKIKNL